MSDIYWFDECPECKAKVTDQMAMPELSGYEGDILHCSKCKATFIVYMSLYKLKKGKRKVQKLKKEAKEVSRLAEKVKKRYPPEYFSKIQREILNQNW